MLTSQTRWLFVHRLDPPDFPLLDPAPRRLLKIRSTIELYPYTFLVRTMRKIRAIALPIEPGIPRGGA